METKLNINAIEDGSIPLSKLSEIPTAESSVFKAIYGVTTYEEVSEAYNQGKIIHCDYESRCYELAVFTGNIAWFSCVNTTTSYLLMLNADSSWDKASYGLENTGNKVDTIQADAKPYQYPSAKAVYDALQNVGGGGGSYDDTGIKKDISDLKENDALQDAELAKLSAEVGKKQDTISDLETIRSGAEKGATAIQEVKTINGQSIVGSGNIDIQGGGGASNEWKCVYDGRFDIGLNKLEFSTLADGTPLKANEVMVQVLMDAAGVLTQGYVVVHSTTNTTDCMYGAIHFGRADASESAPIMCQMNLKASPFYMVAEQYDLIKPLIAQGIALQGRLGNKVPPQIYEDITYIRLISNTPISTVAPLIKIYAR